MSKQKRKLKKNQVQVDGNVYNVGSPTYNQMYEDKFENGDVVWDNLLEEWVSVPKGMNDAWNELYKNQRVGKAQDKVRKGTGSIARPLLDAGLEMTGGAGAYRFAQDPLKNLQGTANILSYASLPGLTMHGLDYMQGKPFFNVTGEDLEGLGNTLDVAGLATLGTTPLIKQGLKVAPKLLNKTSKINPNVGMNFVDESLNTSKITQSKLAAPSPKINTQQPAIDNLSKSLVSESSSGSVKNELKKSKPITELEVERYYKPFLKDDFDTDLLVSKIYEYQKKNPNLSEKEIQYLVLRDSDILNMSNKSTNINLNTKYADAVESLKTKKINLPTEEYLKKRGLNPNETTLGELFNVIGTVPNQQLNTQFTPAELLSIDRYAKGFDDIMNAGLRFNKQRSADRGKISRFSPNFNSYLESPQLVQKAITEDSDILVNAIQQNKFVEETPLYRRVSPFKAKVKQADGTVVEKMYPTDLVEGDEFLEKGFMSTTTHENDGFDIVVNAPGNNKQSFLYLNSVPESSQFINESEALLPPGLKLKHSGKYKDSKPIFDISNPYMQTGVVGTGAIGSQLMSQEGIAPEQKAYGGKITNMKKKNKNNLPKYYNGTPGIGNQNPNFNGPLGGVMNMLNGPLAPLAGMAMSSVTDMVHAINTPERERRPVLQNAASYTFDNGGLVGNYMDAFDAMAFGGMIDPSMAMQQMMYGSYANGGQVPNSVNPITPELLNSAQKSKDYLLKMVNSPLFKERYAASTNKNINDISEKEINDYKNTIIRNINSAKQGDANLEENNLNDVYYGWYNPDVTGKEQITENIKKQQLLDKIGGQKGYNKIKKSDEWLMNNSDKIPSLIGDVVFPLMGQYTSNIYDVLEKKYDNHKVFSRNNENEQSTLDHEYSHASTRGEEDLKFNTNPFVMLNNLDKKYNEYEDKNSYYSQPTEQKARVDAIRKWMMDNNMYDPVNDRFEKKHLDLLKSQKDKFPKTNMLENKPNIYKQMEDIIMPYNDDEIIRMFNTFTSNQKNAPLKIAKYGGIINNYAQGGQVPQNIPVEVEGEEMYEMPNGQVGEFSGPKHENGGMPVSLPEGTKIYSDRLKVNGKTMAARKDKREANIAKLEKLLTKNPNDKFLKEALKRQQETNALQEQGDMQQQEMANQQQAQEEMAMEEMLMGAAQQQMQEGMMMAMGGMIKRADGSYSQRGLWDNIRANKGSGKKPTKEMLAQEKKIKKAEYAYGGMVEYANGTPPYGLLNYVSPTLAANVRKMQDAAFTEEQFNQLTNPQINPLDIREKKGGVNVTTSGVNPYDVMSNVLGQTFQNIAQSKDPYINTKGGMMPNPLYNEQIGNKILFDLQEKEKEKKPNKFMNWLNKAADETGDFFTGLFDGNGKPKRITNTNLNVNPNIKTNYDLTEGDRTGMFGTSVGMYGPAMMTMLNRMETPPNTNYFSTFGQDALRTQEEAEGLAGISKDEAYRKNLMRANALRKQLANTARGVNDIRSGQLTAELAEQEGARGILTNYLQGMSQLKGQRAGLQQQIDQTRMGGEQQRDLADRQDIDQYYTNLAENVANASNMIQKQGRDLNVVQYNKDIMNLSKAYSKYGIYAVRDPRSGLLTLAHTGADGKITYLSEDEAEEIAKKQANVTTTTVKEPKEDK